MSGKRSSPEGGNLHWEWKLTDPLSTAKGTRNHGTLDMILRRCLEREERVSKENA